METARAQALAKLSSTLGPRDLDAKQSLKLIARRLGGRAGIELLEIRTQLLALDNRLREAQDRNKTLLQTGLDYVQFALNELTNLAVQPPRYGSAKVSRTPALYIDNKV